MPLQPIARSSVPAEVFNQIAGDVLNGDIAAGDTLPSERRLAEVLGVSRPSVREALQRLSLAGLVDVRQGDVTTVRDYRRSAGLSLLPHLLMAGGELDLRVARSVLETRLLVGPYAAGLAAERTGAGLAAPLHARLADLAAASGAVGRQRVLLDFWDHIMDGADSIALRLMYNNLRAAYEPAIEALAPALDAAESDHHHLYLALAEAITSGRDGDARALGDELLRPSSQALIAAFAAAEQATERA